MLHTLKSENKPMTVDFHGKNDNNFHNKVIFISDIKEMLTTIWFLNMAKKQMYGTVVELLWWEKCGILVVIIVLRDDKYEFRIEVKVDGTAEWMWTILGDSGRSKTESIFRKKTV